MLKIYFNKPAGFLKLGKFIYGVVNTLRFVFIASQHYNRTLIPSSAKYFFNSGILISPK